MKTRRRTDTGAGNVIGGGLVDSKCIGIPPNRIHGGLFSGSRGSCQAISDQQRRITGGLGTVCTGLTRPKTPSGRRAGLRQRALSPANRPDSLRATCDRGFLLSKSHFALWTNHTNRQRGAENHTNVDWHGWILMWLGCQQDIPPPRLFITPGAITDAKGGGGLATA